MNVIDVGYNVRMPECGTYQSHRLERVVPNYVPAGVRSRGFVAPCFVQVGVALFIIIIIVVIIISWAE